MAQICNDIFVLYLISDIKQIKQIEKAREEEQKYMDEDLINHIDKKNNLKYLENINITDNKKVESQLKEILTEIFNTKGPIKQINERNILYFDISSIDKKMSVSEMNTLFDLSPLLDHFFSSMKKYDEFANLVEEYQNDETNNETIADMVMNNSYIDHIPNKIAIVCQSFLKTELDKLLYKKGTTSTKDIYFFKNFKTPLYHIYDVFNIEVLLNSENIKIFF